MLLSRKKFPQIGGWCVSRLSCVEDRRTGGGGNSSSHYWTRSKDRPRRAIVNCATSKISSGGWLCKCSRSSDNKQRNPPTAGGQTLAKKHDAAPFTIQRSTEYQWTVVALSYSYLDSLASWFKPVLYQHNSMLSSVCLCLRMTVIYWWSWAINVWCSYNWILVALFHAITRNGDWSFQGPERY